MAMSLSILIPVVIASETPHRHDGMATFILLNINSRFTDRENKPTELLAMNIGCAMKPTLKSVLARPQSNNMDGERRDGVLHTPYKTNAFPKIATKARDKLRTQLVMMITCSTVVSVIFSCVTSIYQPR